MRSIVADLRAALDAVIGGTSHGLPVGHQLAIDLGHVVIGPALAVFCGEWAALLWVAVFGVGKQVADGVAAGWRDAAADAAAMIVPTIWVLAILDAHAWSDAAALLSALAGPGWLMVGLLCVYGVVRVRRAQA